MRGGQNKLYSVNQQHLTTFLIKVQNTTAKDTNVTQATCKAILNLHPRYKTTVKSLILSPNQIYCVVGKTQNLNFSLAKSQIASESI